MRDKNGRFTKTVEGLPEKWCVQVTEHNVNVLSKWRTDGWIYDVRGYVMYKGYCKNDPNTQGYWEREIPMNVTLITFEQFKKYVLAEPTTGKNGILGVGGSSGFTLPAKWCIKSEDKEVVDYCNKYGEIPKYNSYQCMNSYAHFPSVKQPTGNYYTTITTIQPGYTEITLEQFKKYVMKQETKTEMKMYTPKELFNPNIVVFLRDQEQYAKLRDALSDVPYKNGHYGLCNWYGAYCYNLNIGQYSSSSTETDPSSCYKECEIVKFEQIDFTMYTVEELLAPGIVVFLETQAEYTLLKNALPTINYHSCKGLCNWEGAHCYRLSTKSYSSESSKTDKGCYKDHTVVTFKQIKFKTDMKKLIGYNFKESKKEFEKAALVIAGLSGWSRMDVHIYVEFIGTEKLRNAGVLDLWFEPMYEETTPNVEIRGYSSTFPSNDTVKFGCQTFTKSEVLTFVDVLKRSGLELISYGREVMQIAEYFIKQK